jgi:hypothetical protein
MLGVGSVYYTSAVLGQVWYTAHVVAVTITILYAWASLDAKYPIRAGLLLGIGFATRPPLGYMFPLFPLGGGAVSGGWKALWDGLRHRHRLPPGCSRAAEVRAAGAGHPGAAVRLQQGPLRQVHRVRHEYLNIAWKERVERWGLFNYHFLSRNLAAALVLLPKIFPHLPFVQYSRHGCPCS